MTKDLAPITFAASDIERMREILETVFGAREVHASDETPLSRSDGKVFTIGDLRVVIMPGKGPGESTYDHVAFRIRDEDVDIYLDRIRSLDLDLMPPRPRVEGERRSIYFHDADHHLFALHTGTFTGRHETYPRVTEAAE